MTKAKKTGVKELDWWNEQPSTVAGVGAKGGIGSTFSGMNLLGIARGTSQSLAESKEEHEKRVKRQRGGAIVLSDVDKDRHVYERYTPKTVVPGDTASVDILGSKGGAIVSGDRTVTSKSHLRCKQLHTFVPGDKVFSSKGRLLCPKCEMHLELYIPFGE